MQKEDLILLSETSNSKVFHILNEKRLEQKDFEEFFQQELIKLFEEECYCQNLSYEEQKSGKVDKFKLSEKGLKQISLITQHLKSNFNPSDIRYEKGALFTKIDEFCFICYLKTKDFSRKLFKQSIELLGKQIDFEKSETEQKSTFIIVNFQFKDVNVLFFF